MARPEYCADCGAELRATASFCDQCGTAIPTTGDPEGGDEADGSIPDHYGHLFGDVYWDTRTIYLLAELPGFALLVMPRSWFVDLFREPLLYLLTEDVELFLWVIRNFRGVGLFLIGVGLASRITLNPERS